jgi:hypothetical protein
VGLLFVAVSAIDKDRREDVADWVIVAGSVALFVSLFLTWSHQFSAAFLNEFGDSAVLQGVPRDPNAWQVYSAMDVLLALLAAGLLTVALVGNRLARLCAVVGVAIALAFTVHALADPPTKGASIYDANRQVPAYVPDSARAGPGETVALVGLGLAVVGLVLSFTAE